MAVAGLYFLGKRLKNSLGITLTTRLWWKQTSWQAETGNFAAEQQDVLKKSVKKKKERDLEIVSILDLRLPGGGSSSLVLLNC